MRPAIKKSKRKRMDLAKIEAELDEKDSYPLHRHVTGLSAKSSSIILQIL
jgi:hypothetical protein